MNDKIHGSKILITGGAGFIGLKLTKVLVGMGHRVVIFDNLSEQIHGQNARFNFIESVEYIRGDVRDKDALRVALDDIDVVFHLAAETGTGQSMYEIERYVSVNEIGTAVLLELLSNIRDRNIDLVLSSSRSIYGEGLYRGEDGSICQPPPRTKQQLAAGHWELHDSSASKLNPIPTHERASPMPGSIYAATKYSQEMLTSVAVSSLPNVRLSILRFQNVYGAGQSLRNPYTGIISIFYNRIRQGLPINIFEDGLESRDFVYISDVVDALVQAISRVSKHTLIANIGSGIPTTVQHLAEKLVYVSGISAKINVSGDYRVGDIRHCYADIAVAKEFLGYSPKVSLEEGLSLFCTWASTEPEYADQSESALQEMKVKGLA